MMLYLAIAAVVVVVIGVSMFVAWLIPAGWMSPTLRQEAAGKADEYVLAVFRGTGAPMEAVLAERDRYVAELLRRSGEQATQRVAAP